MSEFKVVAEAVHPLKAPLIERESRPPGRGKGPGGARSPVIWWSKDRKHKLTRKQKVFCDAYLTQGMTAAYKAVYEAGYAPRSEQRARIFASDLLKQENIRVYLAENRPQHEASMLVTRDYVIEKLKTIAEDSRNDNAKVSALRHLGQFLGMWVERTEVTGKDGGPVGFADQTADLSGVPEENLKRVKELLSARKSSDELN